MPAYNIPESWKHIQQSAGKLIDELEAIRNLQTKLSLRSIGLVSLFFSLLLLGLFLQLTIRGNDSLNINLIATTIPIFVLLLSSLVLSKRKAITSRELTLLASFYLLVYIGVVWFNKFYPIIFLPIVIAFISILTSQRYAFFASTIAIVYSIFVLYDPANGVNPLVASRMVTTNVLLLVIFQFLTKHYSQLISKTLEVTNNLKKLNFNLSDDLQTTAEELDVVRETDSETGAFNKIAFRNRLENLLRFRSENLPVAVFTIEIVPSANEYLTGSSKRYNIELARKIYETIRKVTNDGLIGRISKWDFVASIDLRKTESELDLLLSQLLYDLRLLIKGEMHHLSDDVYIGVAIWSDDGQSADKILDSSNTAVAFANLKKIGVPTWYRSEMHSTLTELKQLVDTIDNCVVLDQLFFEYQPVFSTDTNKVEFYECLVRWKHPSLGLVAPNQFLPIAINGGQIIPITKWCLRKASDLSKIFSSENQVRNRFSVNISPKFLQWAAENSEEFLVFLESLDFLPNSIVIEITEESFISLSMEVLSVVQLLKDRGFELALDDFGAGYSSISQLTSLPLDYLKLDISLVSAVEKSVRKQKTLNAVLNLAMQLGFKVIAEGIETRDELNVVTKMGATLIQGFVLSRPVSEDRLFIR